jgi:hypothetical protein
MVLFIYVVGATKLPQRKPKCDKKKILTLKREGFKHLGTFAVSRETITNWERH